MPKEREGQPCIVEYKWFCLDDEKLFSEEIQVALDVDENHYYLKRVKRKKKRKGRKEKKLK